MISLAFYTILSIWEIRTLHFEYCLQKDKFYPRHHTKDEQDFNTKAWMILNGALYLIMYVNTNNMVVVSSKVKFKE